MQGAVKTLKMSMCLWTPPGFPTKINAVVDPARPSESRLTTISDPDNKNVLVLPSRLRGDRPSLCAAKVALQLLSDISPLCAEVLIQLLAEAVDKTSPLLIETSKFG
jgi:hypothetical protein